MSSPPRDGNRGVKKLKILPRSWLPTDGARPGACGPDSEVTDAHLGGMDRVLSSKQMSEGEGLGRAHSSCPPPTDKPKYKLEERGQPTGTRGLKEDIWDRGSLQRGASHYRVALVLAPSKHSPP